MPSGPDGISNPMEIIEQITYLLFIRQLDDAPTFAESKSLMLKRPVASPPIAAARSRPGSRS